MHRNLRLASSTIALVVVANSAPALAQSTGSVDFDNQAIVVTGARVKGVDGVQLPDTSKAKQVLTQDVIARQNPGQTILDTINLVPGVSFQNNDAYGSSGGTLTIRGFDSTRISLTFDGIQLNDSGNYAIYSNQQLDPEIIDQVNVNLGTTDVDSPTASAVGGTVNYRTITPSDALGAMLSASIGEYNFRRVFGMIQSGDITGMGTKAFISASKATNDNPFNNYGKVDKQQYNARIWQDIGSNGDFVAIAGHYNENRNNFFGSLPLRNDPGRTVGSSSSNRFPANADERTYTINFPCLTAPATTGVADTTNSCGTEFDRRYNPSNTGNIRVASRFTLTDGVVLTVDPSYQYVKANGGGTTTGYEYARVVSSTPLFGYIGGRPYTGVDLNGDGDLLDQVTVLQPSQTRTRRYGLIANLRWDINADNTVRVSYTHDYANHRQTGQIGLLNAAGEPLDVFPVNDGIVDVTGSVLQKRDRQSFAILDQVAGEYRGQFGPLTVNAGLRAPFFKRDLNQYCFTTSASGFVDCFGTNTAANTTYAALNPTLQGPQQRVVKYNRVLPSVGVVYGFDNRTSVFASYS
ncbi:MAG: TonB-dependent receptor plug domain-containing protein, partial [Alphaproteobacteria bacterium]|nr:TonB-dependent receptor plug domain-containing protein [Alphaproteobacteria bacterium]